MADVVALEERAALLAERLQDAEGGPRRGRWPRARRRVRRLGPLVVGFAGLLVCADAVATVVWQEPISALRGSYERRGLDDQLKTLDATVDRELRAPLSTPVADDLPTSGPTKAQRSAALSRRLRKGASRTQAVAGAGTAIGRLSIPRIGERQIFVQGTGHADLRLGPGHYLDTSLPGQGGTVGLAGHRTTYGAPFRHIDRLKKGDSIVLRMPYGVFRYQVQRTRIVAPSEISVLKRARSGERLVLTACHPLFSAAQRIVVTARLTSRASIRRN